MEVCSSLSEPVSLVDDVAQFFTGGKAIGVVDEQVEAPVFDTLRILDGDVRGEDRVRFRPERVALG